MMAEEERITQAPLAFWEGLSGYHLPLAKNDKNLRDVMEVLDAANDLDENDGYNSAGDSTSGSNDSDSDSDRDEEPDAGAQVDSDEDLAALGLSPKASQTQATTFRFTLVCATGIPSPRKRSLTSSVTKSNGW